MFSARSWCHSRDLHPDWRRRRCCPLLPTGGSAPRDACASSVGARTNCKTTRTPVTEGTFFNTISNMAHLANYRQRTAKLFSYKFRRFLKPASILLAVISSKNSTYFTVKSTRRVYNTVRYARKQKKIEFSMQNKCYCCCPTGCSMMITL